MVTVEEYYALRDSLGQTIGEDILNNANIIERLLFHQDFNAIEAWWWKNTMSDDADSRQLDNDYSADSDIIKPKKMTRPMIMLGGKYRIDVKKLELEGASSVIASGISKRVKTSGTKANYLVINGVYDETGSAEFDGLDLICENNGKNDALTTKITDIPTARAAKNKWIDAIDSIGRCDLIVVGTSGAQYAGLMHDYGNHVFMDSNNVKALVGYFEGIPIINAGRYNNTQVIAPVDAGGGNTDTDIYFINQDEDDGVRMAIDDPLITDSTINNFRVYIVDVGYCLINGSDNAAFKLTVRY